MAEDTILSWTPANWITVIIMVVLGFAILGMITKIWQQKKGAVSA
jgi:hypothetical protein